MIARQCFYNLSGTSALLFTQFTEDLPRSCYCECGCRKWLYLVMNCHSSLWYLYEYNTVDLKWIISINQQRNYRNRTRYNFTESKTQWSGFQGLNAIIIISWWFIRCNLSGNVCFNNSIAIRRMKHMSKLHWIYFIISFLSHCIQNGEDSTL